MNFKSVSILFKFSCPSVPRVVTGFTFIPSFNVLNGYFWWRFLLFEFVKFRDLTSLKHFHLSVNDLIGSFLYYNVYTTLLFRIFQIEHIACGLWKRGFTLRYSFFYVEKITCLAALVQNVNLKLAIQTSRQAKMKTIQWKKTPNRRHARH